MGLREATIEEISLQAFPKNSQERRRHDVLWQCSTVGKQRPEKLECDGWKMVWENKQWWRSGVETPTGLNVKRPQQGPAKPSGVDICTSGQPAW